MENLVLFIQFQTNRILVYFGQFIVSHRQNDHIVAIFKRLVLDPRQIIIVKFQLSKLIIVATHAIKSHNRILVHVQMRRQLWNLRGKPTFLGATIWPAIDDICRAATVHWAVFFLMPRARV